jgi:hypothetical protein
VAGHDSDALDPRGPERVDRSVDERTAADRDEAFRDLVAERTKADAAAGGQDLVAAIVLTALRLPGIGKWRGTSSAGRA